MSILAWVFSNGDLRAMAAGEMDRAGEGLTKAGRVLGMIGVGIAILVALLVIAAIVFSVSMPGGWQPVPGNSP
ncbi:MAG: hypothetical protein L0219_18150 [Phycisphaerales bacterium]|nr:hypothetical protein [Phycisphaerales bacterium]